MRQLHLPVILDGGTDTLARLLGDTGISGKRYLGYLSFGGDTWVKMFEIFAESDHLPIVIHCTAGKDRTGVSTAFLLSVLGVDRTLIEVDYLLGSTGVRVKGRSKLTLAPLPSGTTTPKIPEKVLSTSA